jgi:MFS family permease
MADGSVERNGADPHLPHAAGTASARFAFSAQWTTVIPVIVPDQVASIVGPDSPHKEGLSGTVLAAGAVIALFVAPLAGALSDRKRHPRGRRRPFLVTGVIGSCAGLLLMAPFGPGSSLLLYTIAFLHLSFWWNWMAGAYAGMIPDVVPEPHQSVASAWINIMTALGTGLGNLLQARPSCRRSCGLCRAQRRLPLADAAACARATVSRCRRLVHVARLSALVRARPAGVSEFLLGAGHAVFCEHGRVVDLGHAPVLRAGRHRYRAGGERAAGAARGGGDHLVAVVQATSWIMVVATLCYVLIPFRPAFALFAPAALLFSMGWGAYQAVDWALALRVIPSRDFAGKDMGIWHVAFVLPLIIGPVVTGWLVSTLRIEVSAGTAYVGAFSIAMLWFILAAALVTRVRLPRIA